MDYSNKTHFAKWQWDQVHDPAMVAGVFEGDEKSAAFGAGNGGICLGDLEVIKGLNQKYRFFYLPDGRVLDTEGKFLVSGFFPNTDEEPAGSRGSIFSLRVKEYDYLHLYTNKPANKTTGFGLRTSDGQVSSIPVEKLAILESSVEAVRVFVDKNSKEVRVFRNGEQIGASIKLKDECSCRKQDTAHDLYFAFDSNLDHYVDRAVELAKKVEQSFHESEDLANALLPVVEHQKSTNSKNEEFLGEILADKLKTYEIFNGRKFIVAPVEVNTLTTNQTSWNQLAKVVFEKAGLGSKDILITVPYVRCEGIGLDRGEYFFMPGLAYGGEVIVDINELNKGKYSNVQKASRFEAGFIRPVERFVVDVFRHTSKKMLLYKAVFNASNTVECVTVEKDNVSGQAFNKTIRLYYQNAVDELAQLIINQKLAIRQIEESRDQFMSQPRVSVAQKNMANLATTRRLAEMAVKHAEERLAFIEQHAEHDSLTSYQASFYDLKIREEYLDIPYAHEGTKELEIDHTFGVAYIFTDAYNDLRQKLNYREEDLGTINWESEWTFNSKTDYILQQYDQTIYNSVDGASIALGFFGLDFLADGIGVGYSLFRGDIERVGGYSVGVFIAGPEGVVVAKASASALIVLFTKNGIEEVGEGVGKRMLLDLAKKYVDDGIITREVFDGLQKLEEKALAAALKSALKGKIDASQFTFLKKLDAKTLAIVNTWEPEIFLKLEDDLSADAGFAEKFIESVGRNQGLVDSWKLLQNAPDEIRKGVKSLTTVSKFADEGIELTYETIQDGARILTRNGDEVGKLLKEGSDEILEISDDFFVSAASSSSKKFDGITIRSNTGETFTNAGFVKNADGTLGFVEDVSSYGSQAVQNTIKQRGALRSSIAGIKATEDAHHVIPVQLLKENDVVKKAVEAGFEFNTSKNGLAIEKFVKSTGAGRHGPHPNYTEQLREHLDWWARQPGNANFTPTDARTYLEALTNNVKGKINTSTAKINDLSLGLPK